MKKKQKASRASDALLEITHSKNIKSKLTYQSILDILGDRAFGILVLFFALPSALPFSAIPGVSVIFSLPIVLFAFQMMLGKKSLWLPQIIAEKTIPKQKISRVIKATVPYLTKLEYLLKPRLKFMTYSFTKIINGFMILCLAILLMLPIPLSNFIISGLLIIFSLGLIEKDGLFIIAAYLGSIIYISFIYMFILTLVKLW